MKCPGDEEHEGIIVLIQGGKSPHYAKAICAICQVWIKWLNKAQADDLKAVDGLRKEHHPGR